jgi:metal transporter CNNM
VIGAHTMWLLYIFVFITFPITFPLSAIIDKVLGEDAGNVYNKNKMKNLFKIYEKEKLLDP